MNKGISVIGRKNPDTDSICSSTAYANLMEISEPIAGIPCSAILSDTLAFKSPTCTDMDREAAALAEVAGLEMEVFAAVMFRAGSNLLDKVLRSFFTRPHKTNLIRNMGERYEFSNYYS